ncbi:MAG: hypothetical protein ACHP6H_06880, partial [Legionellales bacterium]
MTIFILVLTCAFVLPMAGKAQVNYVLNPSFEQYLRCPVVLDEVGLIKFWSTIDTIHTYPSLGDTFGIPNCSPDYINTCAVGNYMVGAPSNSRFYQYPRTGNGMVQVTMFFDESYSAPDKRDYLQGRLSTHLTAGKTYCVTFYVNFEYSLSIGSEYAVDHISAYLDDGSIDIDTGMNYCGQPHPSIIPQVYTTTIITDTLNWTKVQGSFVANGTEKFITIGNFFDLAHTNYLSFPSNTRFSWYLVDDVSVIESDAAANAGPDVAITYGDSVHIGTSDEGMPCTWYIIPADSMRPIGYSGGIWVKPDSTTTYVEMMDLCGHVTYDTVKVTVWPAGIPLTPKGEPTIWPNPVRDELHVDNAANSILSIYD